MSTAPGASDRSRPGPKLGPISDDASTQHRLWLEPMREAVSARDMTLDQLSAEAGENSKGKVSELLRGVGDYPRWRRVRNLHQALEITTPLSSYEGWWKEGARAAGRKEQWIRACFYEVVPLDQRMPRRTRIAVSIAAALSMVVGSFAGGYLALGHSLFDSATPSPAVTATVTVTAPEGTTTPIQGRVYVVYPTPDPETHGLTGVFVLKDTEVYTADGAPTDLWIRGGTYVFMTCWNGPDVLIAGANGERISASALVDAGGTGAWPASVNRCSGSGEESPSASRSGR
ncbi:hypothetical protein [Streptomyces collinus]|uniref:hypothetical protein n=1 Tax=Streptomyces collinus TaxID=42684 RepID=UPI0033D7B30D